ncbi:RHS repeat-associated core domain-containing protein, partial [Paenibacillus illinoisensis]|uniref:RHS repeat-associated core domain-containing protein n=1 Tax=Paenibacillus illinoisensis TaxID=59845 RepID=UPI0036F2CD51
LKRLRSGAEPGRVVHYTYDPSGNLTTEQVGTFETEFTSTSPTQDLHYTWDNRLQRVGNYPVEMDANGNLLYATDGSTASAYEYDARNRLVKAGKLKYRYNPQGDRIELAQRGQVTRYVIDDAHELSRVLMELDGEGKVKARYVYGLGLIGREDADGTYLSYHYDLRGSTTLLTDEQNRVTDRYTYGLYGELEQREGVTPQPFAYNGRDGVMTDVNGLYYMRARYYDPKLKRFLNRDVIRGDIQDGQTFNRYAYVNGNPVSYIDPLGLMKCETEGAGQGFENRGYKPQPGERTTTSDDWKAQDREARIRSNLSQSAPISIPPTASVKIQSKTGYEQIQFKWSDGDYKYEGRWHTRTPGAPQNQGNTWVVERTTPGNTTGQQKTYHILTGDNQWTPRYEWQTAISARKNGSATAEQNKLLENGHWPAP